MLLGRGVLVVGDIIDSSVNMWPLSQVLNYTDVELGSARCLMAEMTVLMLGVHAVGELYIAANAPCPLACFSQTW